MKISRILIRERLEGKALLTSLRWSDDIVVSTQTYKMLEKLDGAVEKEVRFPDMVEVSPGKSYAKPMLTVALGVWRLVEIGAAQAGQNIHHHTACH